MHFSTTTLLAALSATSTVYARSTTQERRSAVAAAEPRACGDLISPSVGSSYYFSLSSYTNYQHLTFDLSASDLSSGPCTLIAQFGADFPVYESSAQGDELQIRVVGQEGSNSPGSEVGSFRIETPTPAGGRVINSFQCKELLGFDFSIENVVDGDSVSFEADAYNGLFVKVGDQC